MAKSNKTTFSRTLHYFFEAYGQGKLITIVGFLVNFLRQIISWVIVPVGTSQIIGKLSEGDFNFENYIPTLLLVFIPLLINDIILIRIVDWIDWTMDAKGGEYLSNKSFSAIIRQSSDFHNNRFSGSLISQSNKLANAFINFKSCINWNLFPLLCGVILASITVFQIAPIYGLILIAFAATFSIVAFITFRKTAKRDDEYSSATHKQNGVVADSISNAPSVKSFAREEYEEKRIAKANRRVYDATIGLAKASCFRNSFLDGIDFVVQIMMVIFIILGAKMFNLSVANAVLLYTLTSSIVGQLWGITGVFRTFNRAFSDAKEMTEILDLSNDIIDKTNNKLKVRTAEIDIHDITFKHSDAKMPIFEHFSLKVSAGKRIGLVGVSGSGKTTLTKLLLRFADVQDGNILIDGQEIDMVTQKSLRENIAYVPQESSLFHRTIAENIAYGKLNATDEEIKRAARLANADEFIKDLPEGYDTLVGERGIKLSGGQRQRIAIARAILKDAPILILDEATSALDSESEALIQEALNNLMKGRTSIVIAHRLSTVANLDEIVVLNKGKIVEQGTHRQLLLKEGAYKKLWSRQSGAFLDED